MKLNMNIELMKTYFYNNSPAKVIEIKEGTNFVLVSSVVVPYTEITGKEFCTECMVGNQGTPTTHRCHDAQEVIDQVVSDMSEENIFWVDKKFLQEKPVEYVKWTAIQKEIDVIREEVKTSKQNLSETKKAMSEIENSIAEKTAEVLCLDRKIEDLKIAERNVQATIEKSTKERHAKIIGTNFKISLSRLKSLIEESIELQELKNNGVDNWELYSESTLDENKMESRSLEELFQLCDKVDESGNVSC